MRKASAVITLTPGKGRQHAITVPEIESYMIEQSIDNDADAFSIDVGDTKRRLLASLDRDTEVRVDIFGVDDRGVRRQLFAGLADMAQMQESFTHSIQGRDFPSAIMLDTDAEPGRWRRVKPRPFLTARARKLGIKRVSISSMP